MFDKYVGLRLKIDGNNVFMNMADLFSSKKVNHNSEDFYVFDKNGYTQVQEVFDDFSHDTKWFQIILSNGSSIYLNEDQELIIPQKGKDILISVRDIEQGTKLPYCQEKFPNPKAFIEEFSVSMKREVPFRDGYELMTKSQSYIVGGFLLASI